MIYRSFIMSNFIYCPLIWHFCGRVNASKVERLQERAVRFIYNDFTSPYEDLLERDGLSSLEEIRLRFLATEVYKAVNNLSPPHIAALFQPKVLVYNLRNCNKINTVHHNTVRYGINSLSHLGARTWNLLPDSIKDCQSLNSFKRNIQKVDIIKLLGS